MKNDELQRMGVTPFMGDTRVPNKGGKAAKRTLTDLCREARSMRDECRKVLDECWALRDECRPLRDECSRALEAIGFLRRRMRRDLVRLVWFAGGCTLVNVGVWLWAILD